METHEPAVGQKCTKEQREKNPLQRKWVSEPSAGTKISTYGNPDVKRHMHREQSLTSGTSLSSSTQKFSSGKLMSSAVTHSSQESQFQQVFPRPYSYQLPHSYPQEPFLGGTKPQPALEAHAWCFSGQMQSLPPDDMFPVHSHSHGVFPRQKSPAGFGQFSQSGPEQPDESHKKEQKPKKPGKYICHYCGRACAKPSVLKKHIRSHTGERPYPCVPCGFSFKTKSNLYKHRKSHAHAIKAGLVPFSELATRTDTDQASSVGEAEAHSDGEQSTDTDEETAEGAMFPEKRSPQISFEFDKSPMERGPAYADPAEELSVASMKVPILIVPKQGVPSPATECPQFTDIKGSIIGGQMGRGDESHTVKQRLALRLTEKKDQDSEQSQNLLSPHSKGSTDSGYFSRSESAEQQISPPNTSAKTYEEIMFGRTWYHRTNSRSRQSVTVGMVAIACQDTNINKSTAMQELAMGKISEGHVFYQTDCAESQLIAECDPKHYHAGSCQTSTGLLEAPSDSGPLIRSNSMPTPSPTNLNVPPNLRGSHSFDEMMTQDDVFYGGAAGLKRLRRQAAFEHSAQEGHGESENYGKITGLNSSLKMGERGPLMPEFKGSGSEMACPEVRTAYASYGTKVGMTQEFTTRKRRMKKSVGEEEDCLGQDDSSRSGSIEMKGDYDLRQGSQDSAKAAPTSKGSMFRAHSPSDSFDRGSCMTPEDIVLVQDSDTKTAGNVISVIQHTNSLSRPNSFEKTESIEHPFYQPDKHAGQLSEQSDSENIDDVQSPYSHRSESMEHQQQDDNEHGSFSSNPLYHMPHKLVRQPNIQVPEIRVTEEPDKPEKEPEVPVKEPEKHVEEFQWPQRSETLSQLPAEKLPPKKKRLRLADMEHSSGESSFESTCTSLSRSPSQESNLSHSSSFSMSFDREESIKSVSPTKQDDFAKQSEFLTVPGSGHSLSIPGHHQREMRRSSSEQAPCALPTEVPEMRSKSFDYGSLSTSSRQGEVYASASAMKERRRGYLVRQASLSVYPEVVVQQPISELNIKKEHSDHVSQTTLTGTSYCVTSDLARPRRGTQSVLGSHHLLQQSISEDSLSEDHFQNAPCLPAQLSSDSDHSLHEHMTQDLIQHSSLQSNLPSSSFLPFQPMLWHPEPTQRNKQHLAFQAQQLQKLHIKQPNLQPMLQKPYQPPHQIQVQTDSKTDGASHNYPYPSRASQQQFGVLSSKVLTTSFLQQVQPIFATQNVVSQPSLPGMLVPVRIQTNVPSYGSVTYTSVSQIFVTHSQSTNSIRVLCTDNVSTGSLIGTSSKHQVGINLSKILGHSEGSLNIPIWKVPEYLPGSLNTGIPLSMTSGTISTTDASSSIGGSKRMLSPTSSLELFVETKQQKRVKEEKMYGQIVKELSAVELSNSSAPKDKSPNPEFSKRDDSIDEQERMSSSPPTDFLSSKFLGYPSAPHLPDVPPKDNFIPPLQIITNVASRADSPEELDVDESTPEASSSPQSLVSSGDTQEESKQTMGNKFPVKLAANQGGGVVSSTLLLTDLADVHQFFQFPSLRTPTSVSWCFLNYTKPNYAHTTPLTSVYGSWCVSSYNPNPLNLSTKATLALLRSKQRKNTEMYTMAAMYQPGTGKLVSSLRWKQKFDQVVLTSPKNTHKLKKEISLKRKTFRYTFNSFCFCEYILVSDHCIF